jgi:hypothetical protein
MTEFQGERFEKEYRRDSSYKTWTFKGPGVLDVYRRKAAAQSCRAAKRPRRTRQAIDVVH